jgi:hypothetical protein
MASVSAVSQQAATMMQERGIDNPQELLAFATPERIIATCQWWDAKRGAGVGVLAKKIREGGMAESKPARAIDEQQEYGEQVVAWLREHFPQWNREDGNRTHTAAIACVIRLHHKHGKHGLSVREHGPEIRAAVREFDALLGESSR